MFLMGIMAAAHVPAGMRGKKSACRTLVGISKEINNL
jgi:hypothetical protein